MFLAARASPARLVGRILGHAKALSVVVERSRSPVANTRDVERSVARGVPGGGKCRSLVFVHGLGVHWGTGRGKTRPRLLVRVNSIETLRVSLRLEKLLTIGHSMYGFLASPRVRREFKSSASGRLGCCWTLCCFRGRDSFFSFVVSFVPFSKAALRLDTLGAGDSERFDSFVFWSF